MNTKNELINVSSDKKQSPFDVSKLRQNFIHKKNIQKKYLIGGNKSRKNFFKFLNFL